MAVTKGMSVCNLKPGFADDILKCDKLENDLLLQQESLSGPVTQDFISALSPTLKGKPKGADETIEKMKADNAALRKLITCVLCSKEERSVLLLPCAHWVACTKCVLFQTNCPTCGKLIEGFMKVRLC